MTPAWLEEPQHGSNSRRSSANPFTADYTIDQTLHGLSHTDRRRSSSHTDRRRSRRLTIEIPPDFVRLDTIPATPGPSESTFKLDTPIGKESRTDSEPVALLSGPTLPLPSHSYNKKRPGWFNRRWSDLVVFGKFVGPGFMIAVTYSMLLERITERSQAYNPPQLIQETTQQTSQPEHLTTLIFCSSSS